MKTKKQTKTQNAIYAQLRYLERQDEKPRTVSQQLAMSEPEGAVTRARTFDADSLNPSMTRFMQVQEEGPSGVWLARELLKRLEQDPGATLPVLVLGEKLRLIHLLSKTEP